MFGTVISNNAPTPLKIYSIGFSDEIEVTRYGPGRRNQYIIHYVISGRGFYNSNPVLPGQGFLIYPGQSEEYFSDTDDPWSFLWVISDDDGMKEIFKRYNADADTLIFDYGEISEVKKIANEVISKKQSVLDSLEILELFLKLGNSHLSKENYHNKSSSDVYLDFCVNFVEANMYKNIRVDELTALLGVSQPYLYKIFKRRFNMSPKEYIIYCKIHYAKKLLKETDMSVTQISNSVGYDDVLAFSRIFSQREKISPQKFREQGKKR